MAEQHRGSFENTVILTNPNKKNIEALKLYLDTYVMDIQVVEDDRIIGISQYDLEYWIETLEAICICHNTGMKLLSISEPNEYYKYIIIDKEDNSDDCDIKTKVGDYQVYYLDDEDVDRIKIGESPKVKQALYYDGYSDISEYTDSLICIAEDFHVDGVFKLF